jgi:hypothetical protein
MPLRFSRALLVLLAVVLPFEAPLFRAGPLLITTVELVLYALLFAWGLGVVADILLGRTTLKAAFRALREDLMVQAALAWCAVLLASALTAPSHRTEALKFALRCLSGVLAFFAARSLAREPEVGRRVLLALLAGAVLSAATAVIDWLVPVSAPAWQVFRKGEFETLGLQRASGVFAYPTIGAMYWEAIVPLFVVAPVLGARPRTGQGVDRRAVLAVLASALLIGAILASATRSGLAGAAVACGLLIVLSWRTEVRVSRMAGVVLCVLGGLSAVTLSATHFGSLLGHRLQWWQDENWFHAEYEPAEAPRVVQVGQRFEVAVGVRNTGSVSWPWAGDHPTRLSYHWERVEDDASRSGASGAVPVGEFEGVRTTLPEDVPPGATCRVSAVVRGPAAPGTYRLRWDLVQEGVTWFGEQGNPTPAQQVEVTAATESALSMIAEAPLPAENQPPPSRAALWRAAVVLWRERPLLGIGPDNFRRRYEAVLSPGPAGLPYTDTRLHANSMYFETLADLGLMGIAALVFIAVALARVLRAHHRAGRWAGLGFGVAAATFFVHGMLDYFLEFTPLFCLFWLLLGLAAATGSGPRSG